MKTQPKLNLSFFVSEIIKISPVLFCILISLILPIFPLNIISSLKNLDSLERYAREKLFMKKENEEIYIIEFLEK